MAAGRFVVPPYFPARNRDFNLLAGALLYVYQNETTTKANIYTDEALTVLSSNPVVANSSGQFPAVYAEAGTEASPVLYSVSVTTSTGASPGNPFNFDNYRPSVDWETAALALAEAAAESAETSAAEAAVSADEAEAAAVLTAADLAAIEAIAAGSPDAPSIVNKANRDGSNLTGSEPSQFLAAIGGVSTTSLAAAPGSSLVGFIQGGTEAALRTAQSKMRDVVSVKDFGAVGDGVADDRAAAQSAITYVLAQGGGTVVFPDGRYLIRSTPSSDSYDNGILIPWQGSFQPKKGIRLVGPGTLACGDTDMTLVRVSDTFVTLDGLTLTPNGKTGCIALAVVPEDRTQTTTKVSQSYCTTMNMVIDDAGGVQFSEGLIYQVGPTILGGDSGNFYHNNFNWRANNVNVHIRAYPPADGASNFLTRTNFFGGSLLNGNVGFYAGAVGDVAFYGMDFEVINDGTSPLASPTAVYIPDNAPLAYAQHIRLFGGYIEACTRPVHNDSPNSYVSLIDTVSPAPSGTYAGNVAIKAFNRQKLFGANVGATVDRVVNNLGIVTEIIDPTGVRVQRAWVVQLAAVNVGGFTPYLKANPAGLGTAAYHEIGSSNTGARIADFTHASASSPRGVQVRFPSYTAGAGRNFYLTQTADAAATKHTMWDNGDFQVSRSVEAAVSYIVNGVKVVGAQGAAITNPTGGATVDAEARTAIDAILARLEAHGLIAT